MSKLTKLSAVGITLVLILALVPLALAQTATTPSVTVQDQPIQNGTVTIQQVVSNGPGWLVVHRQENGTFGADIGHAALHDGVNDNVQVQIDVSMATQTLYAMLHTDAGVVGTYEFPGPDVPVVVNGEIVNPSFQVTNFAEIQATVTPVSGTPTATAAATEALTPTVAVTETPTLAATETPTVAATETLAPTNTPAPTNTSAAAAAAGTMTPTPAGTPSTLPTTGGTSTPWALIALLSIGGLSLIAGLTLVFARRSQ